VFSLSNIYRSICDTTLFVRITLPLRTYTVTDSCVELLNLVLSSVIWSNNISFASLHNFVSLVHHICVTIKYNVPYIRVFLKSHTRTSLWGNPFSKKSDKKIQKIKEFRIITAAAASS
jgi:hypothetical protein